jgi:hypothetical protein
MPELFIVVYVLGYLGSARYLYRRWQKPTSTLYCNRTHGASGYRPAYNTCCVTQAHRDMGQDPAAAAWLAMLASLLWPLAVLTGLVRADVRLPRRRKREILAGQALVLAERDAGVTPSQPE